MHLCAYVVEPFDGLWHEQYREIVPEVVKAHALQFLLGELLWASPPSRNEVCYIFILLLLCLG